MSAPPTFSRIQFIMASNAVNSIIEATVNGGHVNREAFRMAIENALLEAEIYDAKYGNKGGWRDRMERNFNSANDEEIKR